MNLFNDFYKFIVNFQHLKHLCQNHIFYHPVSTLTNGLSTFWTQSISAINHIRKAVTENGAKVVALPECFNSPYGTKYFREYSESIPDGFTCTKLSKTAKELGIFLIGGSIPELGQKDNKIYNTTTVWNPEGQLVAKHRKMHLFDVDIPGGITFKESDALSPGNQFTTFDINENIKVGLGICYDIQFEEMARLYRLMGCNFLIYPAAFNLTTGPMHWELFQRARAADNQCFVATVSPARNLEADYIAWGHSMVVDPWGKILDSANEKETIVITDIDISAIQQVRQQIPIGFQRRTDLYNTITL